MEPPSGNHSDLAGPSCPAADTAVQAHEPGLHNLFTFLTSQGCLAGLAFERFRQASHRDELGITSLSVIMLVVNYMQVKGVPDTEFDPDWVMRLDSVAGIASVLQDIDGINSNL